MDDGTTYLIVDDYGPVYVVLCEYLDGKQAYFVKPLSEKYGKHPVLGTELCDVFPLSKVFGYTLSRTKFSYCHRKFSRWKRFLGFSLFHQRTAEQAREMANEVARKYLKR